MSNKIVAVLTTVVETVAKTSIDSLEYLKDSLSADHSELLSPD